MNPTTNVQGSAAAVQAKVRCIVADGRHNAFPVIAAWRGSLWMAYRSAVSHQQSGDVLLVRSDDGGARWNEIARLHHAPDTRDPQLIATEDRLLVYTVTTDGAGALNSVVQTTTDGRVLSPPQPVYDSGFVSWRPIRHDGHFWCAMYSRQLDGDRRLHLCESGDGVTWRCASEMGGTTNPPRAWSETCIHIARDGLMTAFLRINCKARSGVTQEQARAEIWEARPPYTNWSVRGRLPFRIEGNGVVEIRGVTYLFTRAFNPIGSANAQNVHVYKDGETRLHCSIPCMRDCAYMIGVEHDGRIVAPFYCTAPDGVHLYLAEIPLANS